MSVKDVIKNSVYEALGGGVTMQARTVILILLAACLAGLYIFAVYRLSSRTAFYSRDLNITMAGLPVIVAAIMIAMQSNLLVSLGMVGALSIVRFRNAVKNTLDLLYLFWSISAGIIVGVGLYMLALVFSLVMTLLIFGLDRLPGTRAPELLVLRGRREQIDYDALFDTLGAHCRSYKEKARSTRGDETELIVEIRTKEKNLLLQALDQMPFLTQVNCVAHDGECRA